MTTGMFLLLFNAAAADPTEDLKRDMMALELFLQDKADYKEFCPELSWKQPEIDVYKKELKSQLPKECKE